MGGALGAARKSISPLGVNQCQPSGLVSPVYGLWDMAVLSHFKKEEISGSRSVADPIVLWLSRAYHAHPRPFPRRKEFKTGAACVPRVIPIQSHRVSFLPPRNVQILTWLKKWTELS